MSTLEIDDMWFDDFKAPIWEGVGVLHHSRLELHLLGSLNLEKQK